VTQCAAVAEQTATEVAMTADVASEPTEAAGSTPSPFNFDAFRTSLNKYGSFNLQNN
jgi:hypothetical protein